VQRYEPSKRRRNTSSVSSPVDTKETKADIEDNNDRTPPRREAENYKQAAEMKDQQRQATELRERLLREKIKKMRKSSFDAVDAHANVH